MKWNPGSDWLNMHAAGGTAGNAGHRFPWRPAGTVNDSAGVRPARSGALRGLCGLGVMLFAGCAPQSLLITPVSARRELVETEVYRDSFLSLDKIALIDVSGVLQNAPKRQLLGEGEHPVSLLLEQLEKARRDPWVKGVILRLNSPGGTVAASELMHDEIIRFREDGKPVIAVMMDVAASGAYYIACACDLIIAQPSTVTGSIGVVMLAFDVSGTMKLLGVKSEAITTGEFKDAGSPLRPMRPQERELFQNIINEMFERFVAVVAEGREELDETAVRSLADGRVYTAQQALDAGLLDGIGTLPDAVDLLKEQVGARRIRLVRYHRPSDYVPTYYAAIPSPSAETAALKLHLETLPPMVSPQFLYLWVPGIP